MRSYSSAVWVPPTEGTIKINVDGATSPSSIAAAAVARDSMGEILSCQNRRLNGFPQPRQLLKGRDHRHPSGHSLVRDLALDRRTIIEDDSLVAHKIFKREKKLIPWKLRDTILAIQEDLNQINRPEFCFVRRTGNNIAHKLAEFALHNNSSSTMLSPPGNIAQLLDKEYLAFVNASVTV